MDSNFSTSDNIPISTEPTASTPPARHSSTSSSMSSDTENERPTRRERPKYGGRKLSGTMIVNRDHPEIEIQNEDFPPDDARAMSPRRNSKDLERLGKEAREALKMQARTLQSSLAALAERIDEVKSDHDKLESENKFLQDYIGGLTRTMSKGELSSSGAGKGKK